MEHFPEPEETLKEMISALTPEGRLFITFGNPWFSPYGSHMQFFTKVPWVNILFSELSTIILTFSPILDDSANVDSVTVTNSNFCENSQIHRWRKPSISSSLSTF